MLHNPHTTKMVFLLQAMHLVKNANANAIWGIINRWRHEISQLQIRLKCVTMGADTVVVYQYQVSTKIKPVSAIVVLNTVIFSKLACISPFFELVHTPYTSPFAWEVVKQEARINLSFFTCTFEFTNLYLFNIAKKL